MGFISRRFSTKEHLLQTRQTQSIRQRLQTEKSSKRWQYLQNIKKKHTHTQAIKDELYAQGDAISNTETNCFDRKMQNQDNLFLINYTSYQDNRNNGRPCEARYLNTLLSIFIVNILELVRVQRIASTGSNPQGIQGRVPAQASNPKTETKASTQFLNESRIYRQSNR